MTITRISLLLVLAALFSLPAAAVVDAGPRDADLPRPSVDLQPGDVVRIVVAALARNDHPYADAGIEITYRFAAPSNRLVTGPLERFAKMVRNPTYGIMIDHVGSEFSEVVLTGNKAYQMVRLTGDDGQTVVFAFRLGKQLDGEYENMWMTEAVWPVAVGERAGQAF